MSAGSEGGGRAVLIGGTRGGISLPYGLIMFRSLRIQGRFMFGRHDADYLIRMDESRIFCLGKSIGMERFNIFKLKEW